ncbi:TetR/AcrR family transcriptional regulator [Actinoplanes sp. NPDC049265]|uniref:TetR/AcrR family transcriptional regulator n=1 Tax=Actinoplanes sp. NPDC049265 TaxID=3363902 RepID=UPI00371C3D8B
MAELRIRRIEGERAKEVFEAAVGVLVAVGYDRFTFDLVAANARASKASLYRRWAGKAELVSEAVCSLDSQGPELPDTGSLSGDLRALTGMRGFFDVERAAVVGALATAIQRDPELHEAMRQKLVADGTRDLRTLLNRARERGEIRPGLDIDLLSSVVPGLVLFRMTFETPGKFPADLVRDIVEQIVLPAALA